MSGVIDVWVNLFTPKAMHRLYMENEELARVVAAWRMEERVRGHDPEEFVAILDANGVDKIIIPSFKMWSYRDHHWMNEVSTEELAEVIAPYAGRMYGMEGIDPRVGLPGLRRLRRAVTEFGFVAAHLHPYGFGVALDDARLYPYYATCAELGIPIVIQTGHSAEKMPSALGRPGLLDPVALHFPELRIVAAHTGWPWVEELLSVVLHNEHVYIATTAHAPRYWPESLVRFADSRGRGKVLFGTDFPVVSHDVALSQIAELPLRDESRAALLREAALAVFPFDGVAP